MIPPLRLKLIFALGTLGIAIAVPLALFFSQPFISYEQSTLEMRDFAYGQYGQRLRFAATASHDGLGGVSLQTAGTNALPPEIKVDLLIVDVVTGKTVGEKSFTVPIRPIRAYRVDLFIDDCESVTDRTYWIDLIVRNPQTVDQVDTRLISSGSVIFSGSVIRPLYQRPAFIPFITILLQRMGQYKPLWLKNYFAIPLILITFIASTGLFLYKIIKDDEASAEHHVSLDGVHATVAKPSKKV